MVSGVSVIPLILSFVTAVPVAAGSDPSAVKSAPEQQEVPATRGLEQPAAATLASWLGYGTLLLRALGARHSRVA